MRQLILVSLAGVLGGAAAGFMIVFSCSVAWTPRLDEILDSLDLGGIGAMFGAAFGFGVFPIIYYLFLKAIPLTTSLAVTIPATIVGGWIGLVFPPDYPQAILTCCVGFPLVAIYAPGFLGLFLSSVALRLLTRKLQSRAALFRKRPDS